MKEEAVIVNNSELIAAVDWLKANKVIRRDKDISDRMEYSKGGLSSYLNNKKPVPEIFMRKFYDSFPGVKKRELSSLAVSGTPIYDLHASASQLDNISQLPEVPSFHVNVPGYEDCNFGMYVYGHSMYPTIENGSLILCKRIQDKEVILYGEIYLIKTRDYLLVKRLQKGTIKKAIQCVSDNREKNNGDSYKFETFDLEIDKVIDLYLVKGIIKKTQS